MCVFWRTPPELPHYRGLIALPPAETYLRSDRRLRLSDMSLIRLEISKERLARLPDVRAIWTKEIGGFSVSDDGDGGRVVCGLRRLRSTPGELAGPPDLLRET